MSWVDNLVPSTKTSEGLSEKKYSIARGKSVPLLSTGSVLRIKAVFLAFDSGNWSVNTFHASRVSKIDFLLMFLELNSKTKS